MTRIKPKSIEEMLELLQPPVRWKEHGNLTMEDRLYDTNIEYYESLPSPAEILKILPVSEKATKTILEGRQTIRNILEGIDKRILMILGPCSIHDPVAGLEYAHKLVALADEVKDKIYIVMRNYLEKPRTTIGWKGILYDPDLDESFHMEKGVIIGRKFLLDVNEIDFNGTRLPCVTEFTRSDFIQDTADLISLAAIGARTVESQLHKEVFSGLSMPVGLKNNSAGDISSAVDACISVFHPQTYPGSTMEAKRCKIRSMGNRNAFVFLRGGKSGPNYYHEKVAETLALLKKAGLPERVVIDCSHANCGKVAERQEEVAYHILEQIKNGNFAIKGIALESNLCGGNQSFPKNAEEIKNLKYGVSITDPCQPFEVTERIARKYANEL